MDKKIIKQLAERYKEICSSPFADGYTFRAFDGECAEKGFTIDDIKNYIEKEKQEKKAKRTESIKSLKEQLKAKEQENEELQQYHNKEKEKNEKLEECNDALFKAIEEVNRINKKLESENEELKKLLKVRIEDLCDSCGASSMMPMPCKVYEKTLIEIKEIAEHHNANAYCNSKVDMRKILQKINECEVDNA